MIDFNDEQIGLACDGGTPRDRQNNALILCSSIVWAACLLVATYLIKRELLPTGPISWIVAILPTFAGICVLMAYSRYLRETDEMRRMIQLNALAVGFGGGWIVMVGYPVLERLGAPSLETAGYVMVMAIFFGVGNVVGWSRYR